MHEALRSLRAERDLSRSRLSRLTVREGYEGVGEKTIEALETYPGRIPEATIIEALAHALDVTPETFYEWPIAVARRDARTTTGLRQIQREAAARIAQTAREEAQRRHEHLERRPETDPGRDAEGGQQ